MEDFDALFTAAPAAPPPAPASVLIPERVTGPGVIPVEEAALSLVPRWKKCSVVARGVGLVRVGVDLLGMFRCLRDVDDKPVAAWMPANQTNRVWPLHVDERPILVRLPPNLAVLATCPWAAHQLHIRQWAKQGAINELLAWNDTVVKRFVAEVVHNGGDDHNNNNNPFEFAARFTEYAALGYWLKRASDESDHRVKPQRGPVVHVPLDPVLSGKVVDSDPKPKRGRPSAAAVAAAEPPTGWIRACTLGELLGGIDDPAFVDDTTIGREELVGCAFESLETLYTALNLNEAVLALRPPWSMAEQDAVPDYEHALDTNAFFQRVNDVNPIPPGMALLRYRLGALEALKIMSCLGEPPVADLLHSVHVADRLTNLSDHDVTMLAKLLDLDSLAPTPELDDAMDLDEDTDGRSAPSLPGPVQELLENATSAAVRRLIFAPEGGRPHQLCQCLTKRDSVHIGSLFQALALSYRLGTRLELSSPAARSLMRRQHLEYQLKWMSSSSPPLQQQRPDKNALFEYLRVRGRRVHPIPDEFLTAPESSASLLLNNEPLYVLKERVERLQQLVFTRLHATVTVTSFEEQLSVPIGGPSDTTEQWLAEHRSMGVIIVPAHYVLPLPRHRASATLGPNGTLGLFVTDLEYIAAVKKAIESEVMARELMTQSLYMRITDAHVYPVDRLTRLLEARARIASLAPDGIGCLEIHGCVELLGAVPDVVKPMTPSLLALRHLADNTMRVPPTDELVGTGSPLVLHGKQPILVQVVDHESAAAADGVTVAGVKQTWLVAEAFQLTRSYIHKHKGRRLARITDSLVGLPINGQLHMEYGHLRDWATVDEIATLCYLLSPAAHPPSLSSSQPMLTLTVHAAAIEQTPTRLNLLDIYCDLVNHAPIPRHRLTNYWTTADV